MKTFIKQVFHALQVAIAGREQSSHINVVAPEATDAQLAELKRRAAFFLPQAAEHLSVHRRVSPGLFLSPSPLLLFGVDRGALPHLKLHSGVFDVDYEKNPLDGWAWIDAARYAENCVPDRPTVRSRFLNGIRHIRQRRLDKCYVFGTGPSLSRASERGWSDGYRVVCNTIVRDKELWRHIDPDILVAGDGIYHFGFTEFARAFRRDLRARLEQSRALFVYPEQFHVIVRRELNHLEDRLIPVPIGQHTVVHSSFDATFALPRLDNVLTLLLLPVGCNLAKHIGLWGFDGRAPDDKLFWANSVKQSYTDLLPTLQTAHPAFFDRSVPKHDPELYVRTVHGDVLENCLSEAETEGWRFEMLHPTWTATLRKRSAFGFPV